MQSVLGPAEWFLVVGLHGSTLRPLKDMKHAGSRKIDALTPGPMHVSQCGN
jgi:hypothetical protein